MNVPAGQNRSGNALDLCRTKDYIPQPQSNRTGLMGQALGGPGEIFALWFQGNLKK